MTIIGIGIDIIETKRINKILKKHLTKFAEKILSNNELIDYMRQINKYRFLTKKFAIKEAASKALGTGMSQEVFFKDFEIYKNKSGKPKIRFLKNALIISKKNKVGKVHVSMTDEKKYLCAIVILERIDNSKK